MKERTIQQQLKKQQAVAWLGVAFCSMYLGFLLINFSSSFMGLGDTKHLLTVVASSLRNRYKRS